MKNRVKLIDYMRNWKLNSLFVRMMGQLFLLVIVPLCGIMAVSYYSYTSMWNQEMKRQCSNMADNLVIKWNGIEAEMEQEFSFVSYDKEVELFVYDDQLLQIHYDVQNIRKLLLLPTLTRDYVENVCVYNIGNGAVIDKAGMHDINEYRESSVLTQVLEKSQERHIIVSDTLMAKGMKSLIGFWEIKRGKSKAVLVMRFSADKLIAHMNLPEYGEFYIMDGETIVLSNNRELIGKQVEMMPHYEALSFDKTVRVGDWYADMRKLDNGDMEIATFLDSNLIKNDLGLIGIFMLLFIGIMTFITVGLAAVISNKLYRPIGEILQFIRKNDNYPDNVEGFEGRDELEYILKSIEKRTYFAEEVDQELKRRLILLKKAQAIALQSQINPHFINNTLETIDYMAVFSQGRNNQVSDMVRALSGMMQYSLGNTDVLVTVREEVKYCEKYIEIQKIRYGNQFEMNWEIDEKTLEYKMVRMILQPIVENAIYHGVKHLPGNGLITIAVSYLGHKIRIEITDNGLGMEKEELEKLKGRLDQEMMQESCHIGLANVYQRLKLYYGEQCEFFVQSRLGCGTCVIIEIPCDEEHRTHAE